MIYFMVATGLFVVIWIAAYFLAGASQYTLFEVFMIIGVSILISSKVREAMDGDSN